MLRQISHCIVGVFSLFTMFSQVQADSGIDLGIRSSLFKQHQEQKIGYELIVGPIEYKEASADYESSGYIARATIKLTGQVKEYIYDFPAKYSSLFVFEKVIKHFDKTAYEKLYYCMEIMCGDKDGWRVYINDTLDGKNGTQYYIVGQKKLSDGSIVYKSIYIIDIDSEPRLVLSVINVPFVIYSATEINEMIETDGKVVFPALSFSNNSTALSLAGISQLQEIANYFSTYDISTKYDVVGHSDSVGNTSYNKKISEERAKTVLNQLIKQFNVNPLQIISHGLGQSQPLDPQKQKYFSNNRRVELVKKDSILIGSKE